MTYRGRVQNGVIVVEDAVNLPEGTLVRIEEMSSQKSEDTEQPMIWKKLLDLAGTVPGLPKDAARQHDHYLYRTPKR